MGFTTQTNACQTHIAGVINEACEIPTACGIDDALGVDAEHVRATDSDLLVVLFPQIGDDWSNTLAHILYHHLICCNGLQGK